jgi:hypothetical protein
MGKLLAHSLVSSMYVEQHSQAWLGSLQRGSRLRDMHLNKLHQTHLSPTQWHSQSSSFLLFTCCSSYNRRN